MISSYYYRIVNVKTQLSANFKICREGLSGSEFLHTIFFKTLQNIVSLHADYNSIVKSGGHLGLYLTGLAITMVTHKVKIELGN